MERLKAFTLLEVTVALLLTGILVVMAYGIIRSFDGLAHHFFHVDEEVEQLRELQLALIMDSDRSEKLMRTATGFDFVDQEKHITYTSTNERVIRDAGAHVDTFHLGLEEVRAYWKGQELSTTQEPADQLALIAVLGGDTMPIHVEHHYDAVTLRALNNGHGDPHP